MKNAITAALENLSATPEEVATAVTSEEIITTGESVAEQEVINTSMGSTPSKPFVAEKNFPWLNCTELMEPDEDETTGEPVTEQVPAAQIDSTAAMLPDGYLVEGFMETTPDGKHRFLKRDYVDRYPKELAATLTTGTPPLTAAAFRTTFLRDAKKLMARGTPDGAKLTAVATMEVQAIKLVAQNKAPAILCDMIAKAAAAVTDAEAFHALYTHLDSIYTFMLLSQQQKGGE